VVAGGETIVLTLANDTWVAAGATFNAQRQAIIDGLDSAGAEATGWNAEVRDKEVVGAVVRTSDTVVTITLTAAAAYDITADETITATVPAAALVTSAIDVTASPTFTVTFVPVARSAPGGVGKRKKRRIVIDGKVHTVRDRAEEQMLLARYVEQQRQALEVAEPAHESGIRARIRRAEKRIKKSETLEINEAAAHLEMLREEDEEILLLLVH
jgi:uncharacterized protein (DUF305 family)